MKLHGSTSTPGPTSASGDQPATDSIGSTTILDAALLAPAQVGAGITRHRLARARIHGNSFSILGSALAADNPIASTHSTPPLDVSSDGAPALLEDLLNRLDQERRTVCDMRRANPQSDWHDPIFVNSWKILLDQQDRIEPTGKATLLHALSEAITDISPAHCSYEAIWLMMENTDSLPVSEQTDILQSLSKKLHVAANDAECRRVFDCLMHRTGKLPDTERAKTYSTLLGKACSLNPAALNHAFITILRASRDLSPASASVCIQALMVAMRSLTPDARLDAFSLLADLTLAHDGHLRHELIGELVAAMECIDEPVQRLASFSKVVANLMQRAADDSVQLVPCLLKGMTLLPVEKRMYALYKIVGLSNMQSPETQAANLPALQQAMKNLEREEVSVSSMDTAEVPNSYRPDGTATEIIAGLASWAMKDNAFQHFPEDYLQSVCDWTMTQPMHDQQTIFNRLTTQLSLDAALVTYGVQLDQDAADVTREFCNLVLKVKCLPPKQQTQLGKPLLAVISAAQDKQRTYMQQMATFLYATIALDTQVIRAL